MIKDGELFLLVEPDARVPRSEGPGNTARFELTNPDLDFSDHPTIAKDELGIRWEHRLAAGDRALVDTLTLQNWSSQQIRLQVGFRSDAHTDCRAGRQGRWSERCGR